MNSSDLFEKVIGFAHEYGLDEITRDNPDHNGNAVLRKNLKDGDDKDAGEYFGFISSSEPTGGKYHDFCLVFFPDAVCKYCAISFGIGSLGFLNDLDEAQIPGTKRLFTRLRRSSARTYFKTDFSDIENTCTIYEAAKKDFPSLEKTLKIYKTVLPAGEIIDLEDPACNCDAIIKAWVATYAKFRGWGTQEQKKKANKAIDELIADNSNTEEPEDEYKNLCEILLRNRFIVLQGAPGTGKTFTAFKIADHLKDGRSRVFNPENIFFTQFHAETTYSDFVCGITPVLDGTSLAYKPDKGILYNAIKQALQKKDDKILLIIDEINRANLSNVLGPVFYLFEKNEGDRRHELKIDDNLKLSKLPSNLYVIATMNTADRSLAVVDFALRRRFTWITLKPRVLNNKELNKDKSFFKEEFNFFEDLFFKYANDNELNLQPGQSYFIASDKGEMEERLKFELMPLMKEYINEGCIIKAKDQLSDYFYEKLKVEMYE